MENSQITTPLPNIWIKISDVIAIIAGSILFIIVIIPTLIFLWFDFKNAVWKGKPYWIWDTISLHCFSGRNKYLLTIVCCYCAIYLTTMKTIEFHTHNSSSWNTIILFINLFSYLSLMGVGIFETHPHPIDKNVRFLACLHLVFAVIFFALNIMANLLWTHICIKNVSDKSKDRSFLLHRILTYLAFIFFFFEFVNSLINFVLLACLDHPDCSEDQLNSNKGLKGFLANLIIKRNDKISDQNWCVLKVATQTDLSALDRPNATEHIERAASSSVSPTDASSSNLNTDHSNLLTDTTGMNNSSPTYGAIRSSGTTDVAISSLACSTPAMPTPNQYYTTGSSNGLGENQHVSARPGSRPKGCNCLERRKIVILCASNYVLELLLIVSTVSATLLQTSIEMPLLKWGIIDPSLNQDICWGGSD